MPSGDSASIDRQHLAEHYDYSLPKELIAQQPLNRREDARLMLVDRQADQIDHYHVRDLTDLLKPGDCLVVNNTKVIPAKLVGFRKSTRGRWQGLFLEADDAGNWRLLGKTRGRIEPGEAVSLQDSEGVERLSLRLVQRLDDGSWVGRPESDEPWETLLQQVGRVPLPNYIRGGNMVDADRTDYQTVYAQAAGAVAAPTAGLHLTKSLLGKLIDAGVNITQLTLHVGIGTFRPVKAERLDEHDMHFEWGEITQPAVDQIRACREAGGRVIAVGTTSVRVLETAAADGFLKRWSGETNLFIRPPYQFQVVDGLLTNFHLPRSTLLMMIRAFGGDQRMQRAYAEAVEQRYRFYSYGDAMLIV